MKHKLFFTLLLAVALCASCTTKEWGFPGEPPMGELPGSGTMATVATENSAIASHIEGAHVVIDMQTGDISGVEIEVAGGGPGGGGPVGF